MSQLEENLLSRLVRLEKTLEAYRKLHTEELDEIQRELADLRRDLEALVKASTMTVGRPALRSVESPHDTEAADSAQCQVCHE